MASCLRGFVLVTAISCAACAPGLMKLPSGAGAPASDVRDALTDATTACQGVRTLSAEVSVSGKVAQQGLRGRMLVGLAAPDSARIEAVAPFGPPVFILVANNGAATLLLPRDERVLEHGKPAEVLEAVAGIPVDAAELRRALTGCPSAPDADSGRAAGEDWRVLSDGPDVAYLHRDARNGPWHLVALIHNPATGERWRAEYKDFQNGLPRSVRLVSEPRNASPGPKTPNPEPGSPFDLRLALSQVDINVTLGDEVFRIQIPRSAAPITLDELRRARPGVRQN